MIQNRGFSLIEIIIVVGVLVFLFSFGVAIDLDVFRQDTFQTEEAKIISILQKARSRAMSNLHDVNHGVCYIPPNYIIFQGSSCTTGDSIPANTQIASNPNTIFHTFVFNRLSGATIGGNIYITDGVKSANITINHEGTIDW